MSSPIPGTRQAPVIRRNAGSRSAGPQLMRGPASGVVPGAMQNPEDPGTPGLMEGGSMPSGPEQGITPASTMGIPGFQDGGGFTPGYQATVQQAEPQGSDPGSGLASGITAGQAIGNNMINSWHNHEARQYQRDQAGREAEQESTVTGIPEDNQSQPSLIDRAKDSVEQFFHHLHGGLLDDNHLPNSSQGAAGPYNPTGSANPVQNATPAPAGGAPSPAAVTTPYGMPTATPAGGAPAQPSAVSTPAPAAATPGAQVPGQPAPQQPPLSKQAAVADATADPGAIQAAQQGIPQKSPAESGQPHSLSPDWYEHSEQLKMQAMRDAWKAGEDPAKVGAAMDQLRTGAVQGQIMRNYAAANAAFMSGDDKALKQALGNVNYYLPNGQGLNFKTASAADVAANDAMKGQPGYDPNMHMGALMYRSPFSGMAGHEGDPPYTTVTQQHISMLANNAMNPQTVQESMLKSYTAQRETQAKIVAAQGANMTGQGRLMLGQAAVDKAGVERNMMGVRTALMQTQGALNIAHAHEYNSKADAGRGGGPKVTIANYNQAMAAASKAVDDAVQGPMTAIPGQVPRLDSNGAPMKDAQGNPVMTMNVSPGAGRSVRDPTKASTAFHGMQQDDAEQAKMFASQIAGANIGITSPMEAADAGARVAKFMHTPSSHPDAKTGKQTPDVVYDGAQNTVHVWDGHVMKNFYLSANISDAAASPVGSGGGSEGPAGNAGGESGESPEQTAGGDAFND